jgi:hypothetical protein
MNTLTGRFVLRLIIGLLTFLIGVFAAIALGNFNPLEGRHARVRRCGEYGRRAPARSLALPVPLPDATTQPRPFVIVKRADIKLTATPHASPVEPVLPSFEDRGEVKSRKAVVPSHGSR